MKAKSILLMLLVPVFLMACSTGKNEAPASQDTTAVAKITESKRGITARVFIKPEKVEDFVVAAQEIIGNTHQETGCEFYELYQSPYDKTQFIFVELYTNQAAIDTHFSKPYFKEFGDKTSSWVAKPTEIRIFDIAGEVK